MSILYKYMGFSLKMGKKFENLPFSDKTSQLPPHTPLQTTLDVCEGPSPFPIYEFYEWTLVIRLFVRFPL